MAYFLEPNQTSEDMSAFCVTIDLSDRDVMHLLAALQLWADADGFKGNYPRYSDYFDDVVPYESWELPSLQERLADRLCHRPSTGRRN